MTNLQEQYPYEPAPKQGMSPWLIALIIVAVLIVVCCICACFGLILLVPQYGTVFSTIIEEVLTATPVY